ncbi:MAG: hypothetical protein GY699_20485 [Desulfobacteraceae bacterium]|nr:hypothetical protein [Desulfobacteraceae bacterium]
MEKDETFTVSIDNKSAEVKTIILTQEQKGKNVVVLDTQKKIRNPAAIPVTGKSKITIKVVFEDPMQIHEIDGRENDPAISIYGKKDKTGNDLDIDPIQKGIQPENRHSFRWRSPEVESVVISNDGKLIYDSLEQIYREGKSDTYRFMVLFTEPMEKVALKFGPDKPYEQTRVKIEPHWTDAALWEGEFTLNPDDFKEMEGAHRRLDYSPFLMPEVSTSGKLKRFKNYPDDPQTSKRGSQDAYQEFTSDHFYQFLPDDRGRIRFTDAYSVKGLDNYKNRIQDCSNKTA